MHFRFVALLVVVALPAFADVPGPKEVCNAPPECVGCGRPMEGEPDCSAEALDAGLVATNCSTYIPGGNTVVFYCPPGVMPVQSCRCANVGGLSVLSFGALVFLGRRRFKK